MPTAVLVLGTSLMAYFLGSLPFAYLIARSQGLDIFKVGTRQAGATNVWRSISPRYGLLVFFADCTKGLGAILICRWVGLSDLWLYIPSAAVMLGHWNSPFTRFRGGDGLSSLAGIALVIVGLASIPAFVAVIIISVGFNSKFKHPTVWGAIGAFLSMFILTGLVNSNLVTWPDFGLTEPWEFIAAPPEISTILIFMGYMSVIFGHSYFHHKRHLVGAYQIESDGATEKTRLGTPS